MTKPWGRPKISTVILNWNRADLLKRTVESYLDTVTVSHDLVIVDNASVDGSRDFIAMICRKDPKHHSLFLDENLGGEAFNPAAETCEGEFIHFSENDMEYLPGWDRELLSKLHVFPEIGQLSPIAPRPQKEQGEIWEEKPARRWSRGDTTTYVSLENVTTTCLIRREVWEAGVRWKSISSESHRFPFDWQFSNDVRVAGYEVAFNDRYVVRNWGHNVEEMAGRVSYYLQNYGSKSWVGVDGFKRRLEEQGYALVEKADGDFVIQKRQDGVVQSRSTRENPLRRSLSALANAKRRFGL
jgi:glycosyltransferase involved in cell wall biosynthesis